MAGGVTIQTTIEDNGLLARLAAAPDVAKDKAKDILRTVALAGVKRVKQDMPVDTGRARASWGVWTPGDVHDDKSGAKEGDAVFQVSGDGQTVTQGTNVPYVEELEKGSSTQAPAGFIEKASEDMANALMSAIDKMLDEVI